MENYWIGTGPFCNPHPSQCEQTPGYIATDTSTSGDGSSCWTGQKIKCQFSKSKWQQTPYYQQLVKDDPSARNSIPEFTWFGTAPLCGASPCDVYKAGKYPVKAGKCGDGSCCSTGEKWLGMTPVTQRQRDAVKEGSKNCWNMSVLQEHTLQAGLAFGASVASSIARMVAHL